ncbi:class I SAM-dependent methyltransferase [Roseibium sp. SCP14]|uniref:class I SAM-dependent methyltransferase n=1 Tax=Roseibium sp. SCP14 TaxID=3141375 RepID=UPI003339AEF4
MIAPHVQINRAHWNHQAPEWVMRGEREWARSEPVWGLWGLPDSDLCLLPHSMEGLDAIELGCGTGYVSGWMSRRGARVTGVDISEEQLATAKRLAHLHGAEIRFRHENAETLEDDDASYDFAISEYGAAIWCDPELWLPEAWRVLRPGGELVFLGHHPLTIICASEDGDQVGNSLHRPYRHLRNVDWSQTESDPGGIEFNRGTEDWFNLFRKVGFDVLNYRELYAPDTAEGVEFGISAEWARVYPAEQAWWLRKQA